MRGRRAPVEGCQVVGSGPVLVEVCRQRLRLVEVRGNTRQGVRGVTRGCLKECRAVSRVGCGRAGSVCRCPSCGFAGGLVEARGCKQARLQACKPQ